MYQANATYFRCHEFRCAAESASSRPIPHVFLAETIIADLDVTVQGKENVIQFQIAIDDTILVEVFESETDLRSVEPNHSQFKSHRRQKEDLLGTFGAELTSLDMQHQITSANIFHDEIDSGFGLEASMQIKQERVSLLVGDQEDSLLGPGALNFVVLDDELFLEDFDGIKLLRTLRLCQHDFTKITLAQNSQEVEMV